MEYRKVDPEAVARDQLHSEALSIESAAYTAECDAVEKRELAKEFNDYKQPAEKSAENAQKLRAEADAFLKAGGVTPEEVDNVHRDFLERWITTIEMNHAGHAASSTVRVQAGLDTNGSELIMAQLETSHKVATGLLDKLVKPKKS